MKSNHELIQEYFESSVNLQCLDYGAKHQLIFLSDIIKPYLYRFHAANILDVAAGSGTFTDLVHKNLPRANYFLIDLSPKSLGKAKQKNRIQGDGQKVPIKSGTIDILLCRQGLHYMEVNSALNEFKRLLKPNGLLLLASEWWLDGDETDEEKEWIDKVAQSRYKPPQILINRKELMGLLQTNDFDVIYKSLNYEKRNIPIETWTHLYSFAGNEYSTNRKYIIENAPDFCKGRGYPNIVNNKVQYISKWMILICGS